MKTTTTITIEFENTGMGQANVSIIGPNDFEVNYDINGDDSRDFELEEGLYDISVSGSSGSKAKLEVTKNVKIPLKTSCPPNQINMGGAFTI